MRLNLPVVNKEYPFPSGETLVSTTDLQGRILYCNRSFITVSGYEEDELLGQPHNMIRHPDMPEEAFRDMWTTIANGQPWSAAVKNRRKDGSHYWVQANVTPLLDGDRPCGYMSVRTEASRAQIQAAESLYATMRAEKSRGQLIHRLQGGQLIESGLSGWLTRLANHSLALRIGALSWAGAVVGLVCGILGTGGWAALSGGALWAAVFGTLFAATVAAFFIQGSLVGPLNRLHAFANRMAAGDMSASLSSDRNDIIGRLEKALNQLSVNVRSIVRDARTEAQQMQQVTREIAAGNLDLSSRTESQASSLEETASSMEEITGTVRQSAQASEQVSELATKANDITIRSSQAVHTVTKTMGEIAESSRRIGEINQVVDSIAFQTNILALNAAVEAARAGEQGRGFAVVAGEVRALAQRTSSAAREIKQLIEASSVKVEAGGKQAGQAQQTLDEAVATVRQVSTLITEIHNGTQEQLMGISQVNEAIAQMDGITQKNAAMVEELASSATSLEAQAATVARSVQIFKVDAGRSSVGSIDAVQLRKQAKDRMRSEGNGSSLEGDWVTAQ
jgi:aerotaxis receptor